MVPTFTTLFPALWKQKQKDLYKFEANLVGTVVPGQPGLLHRKTLSQKPKTNELTKEYITHTRKDTATYKLKLSIFLYFVHLFLLQ